MMFEFLLSSPLWLLSYFSCVKAADFARWNALLLLECTNGCATETSFFPLLVVIPDFLLRICIEHKKLAAERIRGCKCDCLSHVNAKSFLWHFLDFKIVIYYYLRTGSWWNMTHRGQAESCGLDSRNGVHTLRSKARNHFVWTSFIKEPEKVHEINEKWRGIKSLLEHAIQIWSLKIQFKLDVFSVAKAFTVISANEWLCPTPELFESLNAN